ncbi:uncharacterized protein LOC111709391 [Eurytemora carolleeae]|uniref:uncharacterized protein LOC111709391 n=1 Tax=Eurytemora carolleeae TaxID=1294199 RepID=UPI000C76DA7C|nr:uncharacterized protein LOC111709391 [Eurytemora carolleeae]|eukprot:XP_023338810.1 uncharacterized protein LOC111709391 [Eurytemora affinis]
MRITQVLLRKRKMITKPQSYVRNWQWNNSWYLQQERPVKNYKIKEALLERSIPVYTADELISPFLPMADNLPSNEEMFDDTRKKELKRNEDHPYWKVKLINTEIFAKAVFIVMNNKNVSF